MGWVDIESGVLWSEVAPPPVLAYSPSSGGGANIEVRMNDAVGHDNFTIIGSFYEAPIQQDGHIFVQTHPS